MRIATAHLKSITPYSQSRYVLIQKDDNEDHNAHEQRIWIERAHWMNLGGVDHLVIPGIQFKNAIAEAAKFYSEKIPGKGQSTWTKNFLSGILVAENLDTGYTRDTVKSETLLCKVGSGKVPKTFPVIPAWEGVVTYHVMDDMITESVFRRYLEASGRLIGIGKSRPRQSGYSYGCYEVLDLAWDRN
jgi:hypothetical protein